MFMIKENLKIIVVLCLALFAVVSCEEDDGPTVEFVPRDRAEQQVADKDSLIDYLSSHYYNSEFFETGINHSISDIVITELDEGEEVPSGHTLLLNAIETRNTEYLDIDYEYYVLNLNQGGGASPNFTDAVEVRYEGILEETEEVFQVTSTPVQLQLQSNGISPAAIKGWQLILPTFNTAESFSGNVDGTFSYEDFGLGVMFIPSGLGYFFSSQPGIPAYSNLIFKFELLRYEVVDHDGDLVPSYLEDLNDNGDVEDDDTDEDGAPNFVDLDDDNDGVFTRNEDIDGDGDPTNDIGANGIPKYLDPEETESNEDEEE